MTHTYFLYKSTILLIVKVVLNFAFQGSTAKMEEELWRYAKDLLSKGPEEIKLRPELEQVNSELELAEV